MLAYLKIDGVNVVYNKDMKITIHHLREWEKFIITYYDKDEKMHQRIARRIEFNGKAQ